MSLNDWKAALGTIVRETATDLEKEFDTLKSYLGDRLGGDKPVYIQCYRSFGNADALQVRGRVLRGQPLDPSTDRDSVWKNLANSFRRFESDEVPHERIMVTYEGQQVVGQTDDEGYFDLEIPLQAAPPAHRLWHDVAVTLPDILDEETHQPERAVCPVLVPPASAKFGVISDVDDTVLVTGATSFVKMAQLTFLRNARMRMPFEGVAAFYQAIQKGATGEAANPMFYVSSSPWNLYDLLTEFFEVQGLPAGPLMLRDLGFDEHKFIKSSHGDHKLVQIERILAAYPDLPFILIGDSGQHDPEIYEQAVKGFPDRVAAIYIRDVTPETDPDARDDSVQAIAHRVTEGGVPMLLVPDTVAAAEHALDQGYLAESAMADIRGEQAKDAAEPTPTEQVVDEALGDQQP